MNEVYAQTRISLSDLQTLIFAFNSSFFFLQSHILFLQQLRFSLYKQALTER